MTRNRSRFHQSAKIAEHAAGNPADVDGMTRNLSSTVVNPPITTNRHSRTPPSNTFWRQENLPPVQRIGTLFNRPYNDTELIQNTCLPSSLQQPNSSNRNSPPPARGMLRAGVPAVIKWPSKLPEPLTFNPILRTNTLTPLRLSSFPRSNFVSDSRMRSQLPDFKLPGPSAAQTLGRKSPTLERAHHIRQKNQAKENFMALRNLEPFVTKLKDHDKKKPVSSSTLSSHAARGSPPALVGEDDGTTLSLLSENEIDDAHMTVFDIFQSIIKKYEAKGISYEEAYVQACLEFEAKVLMDTEGEKSEVVSKAEGRDEKDKNRRKANVAFDFVSHAKDKLEAEETKTSEQELPISNSNSSSVPLKTNVSGGERDVLNNQGIVDSSPPVSSGDTDSDSEFETVSLRTVKYDKVYDDSESDDVFEFVDDPSAGETEHNGTVRRWQNLWRR